MIFKKKKKRGSHGIENGSSDSWDSVHSTVAQVLVPTQSHTYLNSKNGCWHGFGPETTRLSQIISGHHLWVSVCQWSFQITTMTSDMILWNLSFSIDIARLRKYTQEGILAKSICKGKCSYGLLNTSLITEWVESKLVYFNACERT